MRKRIMAKLAVAAFLITIGSNATASLIITGVIDGPLSGGIPKAVEIYVASDIADLSVYGLGSANNGGGSDGEEFTFTAIAASAGDFIYLSFEAPGFTSFFGFAPDYTTDAMLINGNDAVELFANGVVVDVFGEITVDGSGQPWDYQDGWAYRNNDTGPDGPSFILGNWAFSGTDALDGTDTNTAAATPFPLASYSPRAANAVPEPATIAIFSFGLLGLMFSRKKFF
jgi:hypothetical protein